MHFSKRETAAILAGLRLVQLQLTPDEEILAKLKEAGGFFSALQAIRDWVYADAADLQEPLTADEIDALRERINCSHRTKPLADALANLKNSIGEE